MKKSLKLTPNPDFDDILFYPFKKEVPTKQDKFKKLFWRIYFRKQERKSLDFENEFKDVLLLEKNAKFDNWPYTGKIEVFVGVIAKQSRLKNVDVDNLLKSVLDAMKGIVFKDDAQIYSAMIKKDKMKTTASHVPQDGLSVGIRNLETRRSLFDVKLIYYKEV